MARADGDVHVRFSFLVRNPVLNPDEFRAHYRDVHGPLAAAQRGFRKYTARYVQNHVRQVLRGGPIRADGITATTQVPRSDYTVGFFQEPDYAAVQEDEMFLFDVKRTRSVVGRRIATGGTQGSGTVALIALSPRRPEGLHQTSLAWSVFDLDRHHASALGFGAGDFSAEHLVQARFDDDANARAAIDRFPEWTEVWLVDEIEIFGPSRNDTSAAATRPPSDV